jgi:hypothetical protein
MLQSTWVASTGLCGETGRAKVNVVTTTDGKSFKTKQEELLDGSKFRVAHAYHNLTSADQIEIARKEKRSRATGAKSEEESIETRARQELESWDKKEFGLLVLKQYSQDVVQQHAQARFYHWSDFQEMAKRIRKPLKTCIDDRRGGY